MKTYALDHTLPFLPLPELAATCAAIPEFVAPLVDTQAMAATHAALDEFRRPGGAGEKLQQALLDHQSALPDNASWLRTIWDDMYTSLRAPVPENVNYFFRLDDSRWGADALPRFIRAMAVALAELGGGELPPEENKAGPLAMDQGRSCVYTRIPVRNNDVLRLVPLSGPQTIAVACQGHWYTVPVIDSRGEPVSQTFLSGVFAAIRKEAPALPPAPPVSALTAAERNTAAALRADLQATMTNRFGFDAVERSLLVLQLAPAHASPDDFAHHLLGKDAASRWFDKSLQIIATENGGIGTCFEHAGCDAAIWIYLLNRADAIARENLETNDAERGEAPAAAVRRIRWDVDPSLLERLETARQDFAARSDNIEYVCREFAFLSRENLKACNTSPDAFLQAAFQAAQHKIFGRLGSSYEAVAMRGFAQGRTEAGRSSSGDALAFSLALEKDTPREKLLELYRQMERTHIARLKRCQQGRGVERHVSGLQAMFALYGKELGLPEPALFSDPGWLALKHDILSTSSVASPCIRFFGFGPTSPDGLGVGYTPRTESTGFIVTSFKDGAHAAATFMEAFEQAADALGTLLRSCAAEKQL